MKYNEALQLLALTLDLNTFRKFFWMSALNSKRNATDDVRNLPDRLKDCCITQYE